MLASPEDLPAAVRWRWVDRPGAETAELRIRGDRLAVTGRVVVALDGAPIELDYELGYDSEWRVRRAAVELRAGRQQRTLTAAHDGTGRWLVDGLARPDLAACTDVDLMATPFTNTPPLHRFGLRPGESRRMTVAWIRVPDLAVAAVEQEYARVEVPAGDAARFLYRNLASGFTGELTVDEHLLVLAYGPWQRADG